MNGQRIRDNHEHVIQDCAPYIPPSVWKQYHPFRLTDKRPLSTVAATEALNVAGDIARELIDRFGAKKVVLFGSLARRKFSVRSDIDLAVWGIPASSFYRAVAFATGFSETYKVDLVDGEDCGNTLSEIIRQEGVSL